MIMLCIVDKYNPSESIAEQFGVALPTVNAYLDEHPDIMDKAREFLREVVNGWVGNGSSASIHNPANLHTENTPPEPGPVLPALAPPLAQPPSDIDEHLTEDNESDEDNDNQDEVIETDQQPPQPPANEQLVPPTTQPTPPTAPADKGKQVQHIPSPDPSLPPVDLAPPPMASTYTDRVKANPNHGQQRKKKTTTNNEKASPAVPPPINHNTRPNDKSTCTPAGRQPTFKDTVTALKKRHPKGHPRTLYFRFVNPNDATNHLSGQPNTALLDKFRTLCDIPIRYVSASPDFTKYTVLPEEKTDNDQQAKIQHALATTLGCFSHQLALSFYKYRVSLLFTNVKCITEHIDGTTRLITANNALTNAVRRSSVQAWRDTYLLCDPRENGTCWGPRAHGATTATLFVDILDDYNYTTTKHVHDKVLQFDCGPRITHVAHVRQETIQFHNPSFNEIRCSNCSGPHHTTNPTCPKRPPRCNPNATAFAQALREDPRNAPFIQPTDLQQIIAEAVAKALSQASISSSSSTSALAGRKRK
ncbi:hypothetical protein V8D89_007007 [Ganoderma adspersum]